MDQSRHLGHPVLACFLQGHKSREMERMPDEVVIGEVMQVLRVMFGAEVQEPLAHYVTRWGSDPHAGGSWTFHAPHSGIDDCSILAEPCGRYEGDLERVRFAGEHTTADDVGTVHGAWLSGEREAIAILQEWDDQECLRIGNGEGAAAELTSLQQSALEVDRLREENEEDSSSSSSSDDY